MLIVVAKLFEKCGGALTVIGLLWSMVSGSKPGMRSLSEWLPASLANATLANTVVLAGLVMFGTGFVLKLRVRDREQRAQETAADRFHAAQSVDELSMDDVKDLAKQAAGFEPGASSEGGALGKYYGRPQERLALRPCWPQRRTQSWVGGLPMLPPHVEWPEIGGVPACFLAQLGLYDLPDYIWHGVNPQEGWLVIWGHPEGTVDVIVTFVPHEELEERPQPTGMVHNWLFNMRPEGLKAAFGAAGDVQPKWYLEPVEGPALGSVEDMESGEDFWDQDKGAYVWKETWPLERGALMKSLVTKPDLVSGVDWPSVFGLMAVWRGMIEDRLSTARYQKENEENALQGAILTQRRSIATLIDKGAAETDEQLVQAKRHLADLESKVIDPRQSAGKIDATVKELSKADLFIAEVKTLSETAPFDPEIGAEVLKSMMKVCSADGSQFQQAHFDFLENYARHLFLKAPSVDSALVDFFKPLWELQAKETVIFMGLNGAGLEQAGSHTRLADLPTNPLTGIQFGDMSRFYVDIRLDDLMARNWFAATADITHGV